MHDDTNDILATFSDGFTEFQRRWYGGPNAPYTTLRKEQHPKAMVIACSDARVDPAHVLGASPGELFIVRNIANLVPPYEPDNRHHGVSAALEYAVCELGIPDIVIMGHACCGGIRSLLSPERYDTTIFIRHWMNIAHKAIQAAEDEVPDRDDERMSRACAMWGIRFSLDNLMSFPWIRTRVEDGSTRLHGLFFDLDCGALLRFDRTQGAFTALVSGCGNLV